MINWQKLAEPPATTLRYYESVSFAQLDWHEGLSNDNEFIGVIGLIFDLAWEDANSGYFALDPCDRVGCFDGFIAK